MSTRDRCDPSPRMRYDTYAIPRVPHSFLNLLLSPSPSASAQVLVPFPRCWTAGSGAGLSVRQGVKLLMPDRASREDEREERWRGKDGSRDFRKSFPCHSAHRFFVYLHPRPRDTRGSRPLSFLRPRPWPIANLCRPPELFKRERGWGRRNARCGKVSNHGRDRSVKSKIGLFRSSPASPPRPLLHVSSPSRARPRPSPFALPIRIR